MPVSPPMEDYLEAILVLRREQGKARVKDLSSRLGVARPSVVGALRTLVEKGLVDHAPYGAVTLTAAGEAVAADVLHRHEVLTAFLTAVLHLPAETATRDACRIEHAASPETIRRLQVLGAWLQVHGPASPGWSSFTEQLEERP